MTSSNAAIKMTVVGVGPGAPDLITLRGREAIQTADLVVGFKTVLDVVAGCTGDCRGAPHGLPRPGDRT